MPAPSLSIIIPVLNEAGTINQVLRRLSTLKAVHGLEVVVVDGSSHGTTLKAIEAHSHNELQLKTTLAPTGRGAQMNRGAALADGETLLFLHADTMISQTAVTRLHWEMKHNQTVVGGAFNLGIHSSKKVYRLIEFMAGRRSRITRLPYGDQALFFRKSYFCKTGGYTEIPLMEDVDIMRRIKKRKDRIVILPIRVLTSARRWEKEGVLYGTFRNWLLILLYLLGVSPDRLASFYKSN